MECESSAENGIFPAEFRARAVRMVRADGERGAVTRVAETLGLNRRTLRGWVQSERQYLVNQSAAAARKDLAEAERDKQILLGALRLVVRELRPRE